MAKPYRGVEGFVPELGVTVRECLGCGCLVPGGPTRCKRCAAQSTGSHWSAAFDDRQWRLIANCRVYTASDPAGLPGHNLMIIIERMAAMLDAATETGFTV